MNTERCPRCGRPNRCAQAGNAQPVQDCWCFHTPVAPEALEALPAEARDKACLCPACAAATGDDAQPD
ncbi:MAG TPA: cysteine-rich CWC family protein [Pseudomonas sp.]|nr:cysteine-rich CWC family protein [Pseudomonas sp.]